MINLCVTVFKRHDLLVGCLQSIFAGDLKPDHFFLIDQAQKPELLTEALQYVTCGLTIIDLKEKRGCEASAINWYLENVPEERVIAHEDVIFAANSLRRFVETPGDFVIDETMGVMTYRDRCKAAVGLYDTEMSPNFYRYVDVDYEDRLAQASIHPVAVNCGIQHLVGGTMKGYTPETFGEYLNLNGIAHFNYEKKWGRPLTPGGDTLARARWRQANQ